MSMGAVSQSIGQGSLGSPLGTTPYTQPPPAPLVAPNPSLAPPWAGANSQAIIGGASDMWGNRLGTPPSPGFVSGSPYNQLDNSPILDIASDMSGIGGASDMWGNRLGTPPSPAAIPPYAVPPHKFDTTNLPPPGQWFTAPTYGGGAFNRVPYGGTTLDAQPRPPDVHPWQVGFANFQQNPNITPALNGAGLGGTVSPWAQPVLSAANIPVVSMEF